MRLILSGIALISLAACASTAERETLCPVDHIPLQRRIEYGPGPDVHMEWHSSPAWMAFAEAEKLYTLENKFPYATNMPFSHWHSTPDALFTEKETIVFCPECEKRLARAWQAFERKWKAEQGRASEVRH